MTESKHILTQQLDILFTNLHSDYNNDLLQEENYNHFQIDFLTDDILIKIFEFFTIAEQVEVLTFVCKRWKQLITEMEKVAFFVNTCENDILTFLNKTQNIVAIKLKEIPDNISFILKKISMIQNQVKCLEINDCKITTIKNTNYLYGKQLNKLLIYLTNVLEVITLKSCEFPPKSLLLTLFSIRNLRSLTIGNNPLLLSRDIIALLINCENLTEFGLYYIENLNDSDIKFMFCNSRVVNRLKSLTFDKVFNLNAISYEHILECKHLEKLHIDFSTSLTPNIIFLIKTKLLNLKSLKLYSICTLTSDDLEQFFITNSTIKLQEFFFKDSASNLTDSALVAIAENLKNSLIKLVLKDCTRIINIKTIFQNCQYLRILNLSGCKNINVDNFNLFENYNDNDNENDKEKYMERLEQIILPQHLYNNMKLPKLPFLTHFGLEYKTIDDFDKILDKFKRL